MGDSISYSDRCFEQEFTTSIDAYSEIAQGGRERTSVLPSSSSTHLYAFTLPADSTIDTPNMFTSLASERLGHVEEAAISLTTNTAAYASSLENHSDVSELPPLELKSMPEVLPPSASLVLVLEQPIEDNSPSTLYIRSTSPSPADDGRTGSLVVEQHPFFPTQPPSTTCPVDLLSTIDIPKPTDPDSTQLMGISSSQFFDDDFHSLLFIVDQNTPTPGPPNTLSSLWEKEKVVEDVISGSDSDGQTVCYTSTLLEFFVYFYLYQPQIKERTRTPEGTSQISSEYQDKLSNLSGQSVKLQGSIHQHTQLDHAASQQIAANALPSPGPNGTEATSSLGLKNSVSSPLSLNILLYVSLTLVCLMHRSPVYIF